MANGAGNIKSSVIDVFRALAAESANPATRRSREKAIDSLERFLKSRHIHPESLSRDLIGQWAVWTNYTGHTLKTAIYYLKHLSALNTLAVKSGQATATDAFRTIMAALRAMAPEVIDPVTDSRSIRDITLLASIQDTLSPESQVTRDMFLFAVCSGGMTFRDVAFFRKDAYKGNCPFLKSIAARYARPKAQYLFPLDRSDGTTLLRHKQHKLLMDLLALVGINTSEIRDDIAATVWASLAIRCGFGPDEVAGCVNPALLATMPILALAYKGPTAAPRADELRRQVVAYVTAGPQPTPNQLT
ncbi:MAG: hypothetical protein NC484_00455 [Alloprevotella sp.]|nr:hypothetical protein [Alloprevotella sp.]